MNSHKCLESFFFSVESISKCKAVFPLHTNTRPTAGSRANMGGPTEISDYRPMNIQFPFSQSDS